MQFSRAGGNVTVTVKLMFSCSMSPYKLPAPLRFCTIYEFAMDRQQNAHHRGLSARPDAPVQSLAAPTIDPDRYVMTIAVEAQQNDDASSWSPAGLRDPLAISTPTLLSCHPQPLPTAPSRPAATPSLVKHKTSRHHHHLARRRSSAKIPIVIAAPPPRDLPRVPSR